MKTLVPLKLVALLAITALSLVGHAQKHKQVEVTFEGDKAKCDPKPLPRDQRERIAVARFNVTATNTPPELGANLSTMRESGLNEMQCFRILEGRGNLSDMTQLTMDR